MPTENFPRILKLAEVLKLTKLSAASLYRLARSDDRLKPFKLSTCASAWEAPKVESWLRERIAAKPGDAAKATTAARATEKMKRTAKAGVTPSMPKLQNSSILSGRILQFI